MKTPFHSAGVIALAMALSVSVSPGAFALQGASKPTDDGSIVVTGKRDQRSGWRSAEGDNVIVFSDGTEQELVSTVKALDKLHFLLSVLTGTVDKPNDAVKLRIYLVGDGVEFDAMNLQNIRAQEGPFASYFPPSRYYDPREDGPVQASSRYDRRIVVRQGRPIDSIDFAAIAAASAPQDSGPGGGAAPGVAAQLGASFAQGVAVGFARNSTTPISANELGYIQTSNSALFASYAQHFLVTRMPGAYPRWYVDGFGLVFSTLDPRRDDKVEYGRHVEGFAAIRERFSRYRIKDILDGTYLTLSPSKTQWNPGMAWLLTHYLMFSPERTGQLRAYIKALNSGQSLTEAAKLFGDPDALDRELKAYANSSTYPYEVLSFPAGKFIEPAVRTLTKGEAAFIKGRLALGSRTTLPPLPAAGTPAKTAAAMNAAYAKALRDQQKWMDQLRKDANRFPRDYHAQMLLAEAECRIGNAAPCKSAATAAAAVRPGDGPALTWQGISMILSAEAAPADQREALFKQARRTIAAANRIDPDAPLPLIAYSRTFDRASTDAKDLAIAGLARTVQLVPQSSQNRVTLASMLQQTGSTPKARAIAMPVARGPFDSPEKPIAEAIVASSVEPVQHEAEGAPAAP